MLAVFLALCVQFQWDCREEEMKAAHLEHWVVRPTLQKLARFDSRLNSPPSVGLMMGTAAQESDLWFNLVQIGGGPGRGGYSIEPETHADVWRYLNRQANWELREIVLGLVPEAAVSIDKAGNYSVKESQLVTNMAYSTAIARIRYWYIPESLPDSLEGWAAYYKKYFNTNAGAATPEQFIKKYNLLVADK